MTAPASREASFVSGSAEQTRRTGAVIGKRLRAGDVVALCGPLGAGKTELVKGIAAGLDVPENQRVASPTFVLVREYAGRLTLFHIDAYRLSGASDLADLGFDEMCSAPDAAVAIEWADRVPEALPGEALRVDLEHDGDDRRLIHVTGPNSRSAAAAIAADLAEFLAAAPAENRQAGG